MKGTEGATPLGPAPADPAPPSPEHLWQARAEQAESRITELEAQVADLTQQLADAQAQHAADQQRRGLLDELTAQQSIDPDTALVLLTAALQNNPAADASQAVRELRARKPHLFAAVTPPHASSVMAPATAPLDPLISLADTARRTNDRSALLRYLRSRRNR
jgi:small-conductance mechanosensitive channel